MCTTERIFVRFFYLSRGCRQGDPISPYIFYIMCRSSRKNDKEKQDYQGHYYKYKRIQNNMLMTLSFYLMVRKVHLMKP